MLTLSQALCLEFTQRAFYLTGRETITVPGSVIMGLHIKLGQAENREEAPVATRSLRPQGWELGLGGPSEKISQWERQTEQCYGQSTRSSFQILSST